MSGDGTKDKLRLGFLTAVEMPERGFVGGLLITNHLGRPLEFQCTTPVQPNKTQQILYGPTLVPFILSELIGKTLVDKVSVKPDLILTENRDLLELREHVTIPVACLGDDHLDEGDADAPSTDSATRDDGAAADVEESRMNIGRQTLRFHGGHRADRQTLEKKSHLIPRGADLLEPFERVREALQETAGTGVRR